MTSFQFVRVMVLTVLWCFCQGQQQYGESVFVPDQRVQAPSQERADTAQDSNEGIPSDVVRENNDLFKLPVPPKIDFPAIQLETDIEKAELDIRAKRARQLKSLKQLRRIESMLDEMIPRVTPCVVSIGETATGVIVKPSGIVITASHVTRKAGRVLVVRLHDGRVVKGITLGSNAANDTSAIQLVGAGPWPYLKTVAPDYTAQAGQWCVAFGYPLNWARDKPASARLGRVTGQYRGKIVTDCPIMGGDSGGALVDMDGNLLGINSSVRLDVTQNLHVPIKRYREDWQYMMTRQDVDIVTTKNKESSTTVENEKQKKPYLGIYGESSWKSVRIRDIRRGSPAEKAGLLPEDVILQIDKTPIESFAELLKYLSQRKGGETIIVGINRFGMSLNIPVTLDAR